MPYKLILMLYEGADREEDERLLASSHLPFATETEATAAYQRAVAAGAAVPAASPFAALLDAKSVLEGLVPPCTAAYTPHGQARVTCTRPRGHERLRLKHRGPEPNAVEW